MSLYCYVLQIEQDTVRQRLRTCAALKQQLHHDPSSVNGVPCFVTAFPSPADHANHYIGPVSIEFTWHCLFTCENETGIGHVMK